MELETKRKKEKKGKIPKVSPCHGCPVSPTHTGIFGFKAWTASRWPNIVSTDLSIDTPSQ